MPFQVALASGRVLEVKTATGEACAKLRKEVADLLEQHERSFGLSTGGKVLADIDLVPDSQVTVILVNLSWVGATESRVQDLGGGEFEIVGDAVKGDSKFNALCEVGFYDGLEYFEVEVVEGSSAFIGIATKAGFAEGYKIKGLLFGGPGNLSDGAGGKRIGYGESVKKGSVIGVTIDLSNESAVGATFWQDGKCLGEAFKDCKRSPGATVFPVVSAKSVGDRFRLSLTRTARVPEKRTPHPAHGSWDLQRFVAAGENVALDAALGVKGKGKGGGYVGDEAPQGHIVMQLMQTPADPAIFRLRIRLGNTLMTSVQITVGDDDSETLKLGPVAGTMMMSPPPLADLERLLSSALPAVTSWSIAGVGKDARLQMRGEGTELDFIYYEAPVAEAVTDVTLP